MLSFDAILPMKQLRADVKLSAKYRQIVTSIRAVGLVEPPVVTADKENPGIYFMLDGQLRCCQSNGNWSPVWRNFPNPGLALAHDGAPLSQGG